MLKLDTTHTYLKTNIHIFIIIITLLINTILLTLGSIKYTIFTQNILNRGYCDVLKTVRVPSKSQ